MLVRFLSRMQNDVEAHHKSVQHAGQQQKIPDALLMADELAAQAEEEGKIRIWNKLQSSAEQFSSTYRGADLLQDYLCELLLLYVKVVSLAVESCRQGCMTILSASYSYNYLHPHSA